MIRRRGPRTIRSALWLGMGTVGLLLLGSGVLGWWAIRGESAAVRRTLGNLEREVDLNLRLSTQIAQELLAAERYLGGTASAQQDFERMGYEVRRTARSLGRLSGRTTEDAQLVSAIMRDVADAEAHYAMAHRLRDLGLSAEAQARSAQASPHSRAALVNLGKLAEVQSRTMREDAATLTRDADRRLAVELALLAAALLLAGAIAVRTVASVVRPLRAAVAHARRLAEGDLTARTRADGLALEFAELVTAMNQAADSLASVAAVVMRTADEVAGSAETVAAGAEQITSAAGGVAQAMSEVTEGAEEQVGQLREVDESLGEIGGSARDLRAGAGEVEALAGSIRHAAEEKRAEVGESLGALRSVRDTVYAAAADVDSLREAVARIRSFVDLVSAISSQSELLALNAAIEAARAGEHGRGFGVVAGEIGALAEQTKRAAREVVETTKVVTARIDAAGGSMSSGVARVGDIERLSSELDSALGSIAEAAGRMGEAAGRVGAVAQRNTAAVEAATGAVSRVAHAAEGYAATAQEVSASAEEQSAACEEVSATAAGLQGSSDRLQEAVRRLRFASHEGDGVPREPAMLVREPELVA